MKKIFHRNVLTPNNKNHLYNIYPKNRNRFFRPKTALKKKESPTKIINRNILNSTTKHDTYNSLSGVNSINNIYQSKKNYILHRNKNLLLNIEV